ncbi:MAG: rRNA maturation RNase YbeY [Eubacteriales bacterium]|nr:rRNA maturation RNase YbeY [Eubacteriales bacterium]
MSRIVRHYNNDKRYLRIYFSDEGDVSTDYKLKMTVRRAIAATLEYEKIIRDAEVSVTFCDRDYIHSLNLEYRGVDRDTDVLSFPLNNDIDVDSDDVPMLPLGDIVICLDKAAQQACELEHGFLREVAFLAIHSTLHLLGYDHERSEEDDRDMCRRQKEIVDSLKIEEKCDNAYCDEATDTKKTEI